MIRELRLSYPIPLLCRALEVSESGYYAKESRKTSTREQEEQRLEADIRAAHVRTRRTYGAERMTKRPGGRIIIESSGSQTAF